MAILSDEQYDFIEKNANLSPSDFMLTGNYPFWDMKFIAQQLVGRNLAKNKLPTWFETKKIHYPERISMEQCSSEQTSIFKANILGVGSGVDLTGGFGVDTYYISQKVKSIVYCEQNKELSSIALHNFSQFDQKNIEVFIGDSLNYIKNCSPIDWIYIDPSRRKGNDKVYNLSDCSPNILNYLSLLFSKSPVILIKTSPLLDIKKTLSDLSGVKKVYVISVNNDCKEVLYLLEENFNGEPHISCNNLKSDQSEVFNFTFSEENEVQLKYSEPLKYLYEPNSSIMKAGAFKMVAKYFGLYKIHVNSHLYTSDKHINQFPGRSFIVYNIISPDQKSIPSMLEGKGNLTCRNYPQNIDLLRKKLKIKNGGEFYIFATTLQSGKARLIICKKSKSQ
ncbi:MAG: SAM-dependent methyltransferase [Flavobacteriales bacterium]|nr:SAM-dependent methyltransferase [Flavobacteriales bacterium]|tara:strand:+ start:4647 stop:5822 length:1176 start_codon:yes stop_codon:yes gene_type:complete